MNLYLEQWQPPPRCRESAFCRTVVARDSGRFGVFVRCRRRGAQSRRAHGERIWHLPTTAGV